MAITLRARARSMFRDPAEPVPAYEWENKQRTDRQETNAQGVPLWDIEVSAVNGFGRREYLTLRVASPTKPSLADIAQLPLLDLAELTDD